MSNCITLHKNRVLFMYHELDADGLEELLNRAHEMPPGERSEAEADANAAWWFLQANTVFGPMGVEIAFGQGRSSHTWRDFRWLLRMLSKYVLKAKTHRFLAADESDGFDQTFWLPVDFQAGQVIGANT